MNLPDFIAKRTINSKSGEFSATIYKIAVSSIGIGLAIMICSLLILGGFKQAIQEKIFSFSGDLQVSKYTLSNSLEANPISKDSKFYHAHDSIEGISHVQSFAYKAGLLKASEAVEGVILKGVDTDFDTTSFEDYMLAGRLPFIDTENYSSEVVISKNLSKLLKIELGDKLLMYFVQTPPRYRQIEVVGLYQTGLEDFDNKIILGDIGMIRRLNGWDSDQVSGFEVFVSDQSSIEEIEKQVFENIEVNEYVNKTKEQYSQYFDWLSLLNQNVRFFIGLILIVACFNMVTVLFILIMERTNMIGVLKSLGAANVMIRKIFFYSGIRLTLKGLFYGNLLSLSLCALQYYFNIIPLDPENYYMSFVPVAWDFSSIILVNFLVLLIVGLSLILPTVIITRLSPIKAIRFD